MYIGKLPLAPLPLADETITSWAARTALYYDVDAWAFIESIYRRIDLRPRQFQFQPFRHRNQNFFNLSLLNGDEVTKLCEAICVSPSDLEAISLFNTVTEMFASHTRPDSTWPMVCTNCLTDMVDEVGFVYERRCWRESTRFACPVHRTSLLPSKNFYARCGTKDCVGGGSSQGIADAEYSGRFHAARVPEYSRDVCSRDFESDIHGLSAKFKCTAASFATLLSDLIWLALFCLDSAHGRLAVSAQDRFLPRRDRQNLFDCIASFDVIILSSIIPDVAACLAGHVPSLNDLFSSTLKRYELFDGVPFHPSAPERSYGYSHEPNGFFAAMISEWPRPWRLQFTDVFESQQRMKSRFSILRQQSHSSRRSQPRASSNNG